MTAAPVRLGAVPVAEMSPDTARWRPAKTCTECGQPARWQVGSDHESCDEHLSDVIRTAFYAANLAVTS